MNLSLEARNANHLRKQFQGIGLAGHKNWHHWVQTAPLVAWNAGSLQEAANSPRYQFKSGYTPSPLPPTSKPDEPESGG